MIDAPGPSSEPEPDDWRGEYVRQLDRRIDKSLAYLSGAPAALVRTHIRSFLSLLNETHRFAKLNQKSFELISRLHPLPLRWGLGSVWEAELRFAVEQVPDGRSDLTAEYLCSLGDVYMYRGQFNQAIAEEEQVLGMQAAPLVQAAHAARILFTCYRADGRPQLADELIRRVSERFYGDLPAAETPVQAAQAWLQFQQCQLVLLRERGQTDRALELVEDMLGLDAREGRPDLTQTAGLLTDRSTLLWARGRYQESVADLKQAMQLFAQAQDQFNAESLKSNLGLVYWTMGELDLAEKTLLEVIRFYRETGSDHLQTYGVSYLGLVYFARGDLEPALSLTQEHIDLAERINFVHEYYRGRRNLGEILYYFGEYDRAIAETEAAHAYYEKRGSREAYGQDVLWLALCYHARGERGRALSAAQETLARGLDLKSRVLEQLALRCLAEITPPEAQAQREEYLLRSLRLAQEMGRKHEQAAVHLALAGFYADQRRQEEWNKGAEILQEIGAEKWLEGRLPAEPPFLPLLL